MGVKWLILSYQNFNFLLHIATRSLFMYFLDSSFFITGPSVEPPVWFTSAGAGYLCSWFFDLVLNELRQRISGSAFLLSLFLCNIFFLLLLNGASISVLVSSIIYYCHWVNIMFLLKEIFCYPPIGNLLSHSINASMHAVQAQILARGSNKSSVRWTQFMVRHITFQEAASMYISCKSALVTSLRILRWRQAEILTILVWKISFVSSSCIIYLILFLQCRHQASFALIFESEECYY